MGLGYVSPFPVDMGPCTVHDKFQADGAFDTILLFCDKK